MNITASAPATYTVARTKHGAKIHRTRSYVVRVGKDAGKTGIVSWCGVESYRGEAGWNGRGALHTSFEVEVGTTPAGPICSKCFPGVAEIAAPVAPKPAPRPAAPVAPKPVAAKISYVAAFEMIEAAGHADLVGGRDRFLGKNDEYAEGEMDLDYIVSTIAEWNAR